MWLLNVSQGFVPEMLSQHKHTHFIYSFFSQEEQQGCFVPSYFLLRSNMKALKNVCDTTNQRAVYPTYDIA